MSKKIYQSTIVLVIIVMFVMIIVMDRNYSALLKTVDEKDAIIENQMLINDELQGEIRSAEVLTLPTYQYTEEEVILLAKCVQTEAGDYAKHKNSQKLVAQVVLNRVKSGEFPNSIEEVIYDKQHGVQFDVAYNGMIDKCVLEQETLNNVYSVLMFGGDLPSNVLYFYSDKVKDNWVNKLDIYTVLEGTVFAY